MTTDIISFGPFRLIVGERLLIRDGNPVDLGGRALDLLIALTSRPNELVGKRDLIAHVWRDVFVEDGSLRVHMAALRKALGDGEGGARYIVTLAGRGYCFVAPVSLLSNPPDANVAGTAAAVANANLPARLTRMLGRSGDVEAISTQLAASRFVTVVGPGGVGKTTVSIAVAHQMFNAFERSVYFVDLGGLSNAGLIASSVASALGLSVKTDDPTPNVVAFLRDKRVLLVLDNCEHVIEPAAALTNRIFAAGPGVHILATSREPLRVEGEQLYKLMPLDVPGAEPELTAAAASTYSAVQLFLDRAAAGGAEFACTDAEAAIVAAICRRVDGLPLAIELTAARVGTYGPAGILELLDQRLNMLWSGHRTAPPRQKTLRALVDWSYGLLSDFEKFVLRCISVFASHFTAEAALAVIGTENGDESLSFGAIDSLVSKSLISTSPVGKTVRYRLSETTRAYLLEINKTDAQWTDAAARHAMFYAESLEQSVAHWSRSCQAPERTLLLTELADIRAALEWCFGPEGDTEIGVRLASAAVSVFMTLSLLTECLRWSERALLSFRDAEPLEMHLTAAYGMSFMFTLGNGEPARAALNRSLEIARERADTVAELRSLGLLHMYNRRIGDYRAALECSERSLTLAQATRDPQDIALARCLLGVSQYHVGDLASARVQLEDGLNLREGRERSSPYLLGFDPYNLATSILAKALWLRGYPVQAVELAREAVRDAERMECPVTTAIALTWALSILVSTGEFETAEETLEHMLSYSAAHSLRPNMAQGQGFQGEVALHHGRVDSALESLQTCLAELQAARFSLWATRFSISLAEGLIAAERAEEALAVIERSIADVNASGELVYMPELFRAKGCAFNAMASSGRARAEAYLCRSLELSRKQGARLWELRAATNLANIWADNGSLAAARELLKPILERFVEGHHTADLAAANKLLSSLGR